MLRPLLQPLVTNKQKTMENLISEIPNCPDSITTASARELFMDLCREKIDQQRLTADVLEAITGYCFLTQVQRLAEQALLHTPDDFTWHDLWMLCTRRESEYSEKLGLTPLDRKNLGLM